MFRKTCCEINVFCSVWKPGIIFGRNGRIGMIGQECNMAGRSDPRLFTPEVRMTVVRLHQLPQMTLPQALMLQ